MLLAVLSISHNFFFRMTNMGVVYSGTQQTILLMLFTKLNADGRISILLIQVGQSIELEVAIRPGLSILAIATSKYPICDENTLHKLEQSYSQSPRQRLNNADSITKGRP